MFPIKIINNTSEIPNDDICFLISDKIYLKKKTGIIESLTPVSNIGFKDPIVPYAKLHIKKIPASLIAKILLFFKIVSKVFHSEAIVLLCYNSKNKKYKIIVPSQEVSHASVRYTPTVSPKNYDLISTIHSHNNFGAFHSGTDVNDEMGFDGLHVTFGNVDEDNFTISATIVANDIRFLINPMDYISGIEIINNFENEYDWQLWSKNDKKSSLRYKCIYDKNVFIDDAWFKNVSKIIPKFNARYRGSTLNNNLNFNDFGFSSSNMFCGGFESFNEIYNNEFLNLANVLNANDESDIPSNEDNNKNETVIHDFSKIMNFKKEDSKCDKYDPCDHCPFSKLSRKEN